MKSIACLIPVALVCAATAGYAASTEKPVPATKDVRASGATAPADTSAPAPQKATVSDGRTIATDQILEQLFGRRSNDLIRKGAGGSTVLDLQGRFSTVSIIVRQPDGTLRPFCVDNIDAARKLLAGPRPAVPPLASSPAPVQ
jgi:hypothetical protein